MQYFVFQSTFCDDTEVFDVYRTILYIQLYGKLKLNCSCSNIITLFKLKKFCVQIRKHVFSKIEPSTLLFTEAHLGPIKK